jgi:hypothetical protein
MEYLDDDIYEQIDIKNKYSNMEDYSDIHNKRIIGIYTYNQNNLLFGSCVDSKTYFQYIHNSQIFKYLIENMTDASWFNKKTPISIMKVQYNNDVLNVIDKTIWLRIIQRRWKAKWKQYKSELISSHQKQYFREIGKVKHYRSPICGLLYDYSKDSAIA